MIAIFPVVIALLLLLEWRIDVIGRRILLQLKDGQERSSLELRELFGGVTYMALHRLEEEGLIAARERHENVLARGGRPRRYYRAVS